MVVYQKLLDPQMPKSGMVGKWHFWISCSLVTKPSLLHFYFFCCKIGVILSWAVGIATCGMGS